jgi:iron complex outermembrane receptor protein
MLKKLCFLLLISIFTDGVLTAQTLVGKITDAQTGEALVMVNVLAPQRKGAISDNNGRYSLSLSPGTARIQFSYVGYAAFTVEVTLAADETKELNIKLVPVNEVLQTVVISAGKFEQRVEQTTISLEVIKPNLIRDKNTVNLEAALDQVPGVIITDKQANIRSGSGWSFGTGSRVQMMVDDMPLLSPDAGQIQWQLLPVEAVHQMEVIKAASSVLYGTAAMNGLINVRTIEPKAEPLTQVNIWGGAWGSPKRQELKWWDGTQLHGGFSFVHARKVGTADITVSGFFSRDDNFRWQEEEQLNRMNLKMQFYPSKIKGLAWGINSSVLYSETGDALLWWDYDNAYIPRDSSATRSNGWDYYIDPFVIYRHGKNKHSLRGRFMGINNNARSEVTNYENYNTYYFTEYQFQHFFANDFWVTAGVLGALGYSTSEVFGGYHTTANSAVFAQIDKRIGMLSLSGGVRYEYFQLDERSFSKPVFRAGANYQLGEATFLRASWGQGFRYPSMAEAFTETNVGSTHVYPNPTINAETGWTSEIGIKQGFKLGDNWQGFADAAGFINHFDNMIEFSFGLWGNTANPFDNIGFKSLNVGATQIAGLELTLNGMGKVGDVDLRILAGYTYTKPIALTPDSVYAYFTDLGGESVGVSYASTSSNPTNGILKYRYQHLFRFDVNAEYKGFGIGGSIRYNDFMQNIDAIFEENLGSFEFFPGVKASRQALPNGDLVFDARVYYQITQQWRVSFIIDNANNREFTPRPAQLGPPRKFTLQVLYAL